MNVGVGCEILAKLQMGLVNYHESVYRWVQMGKRTLIVSALTGSIGRQLDNQPSPSRAGTTVTIWIMVQKMIARLRKLTKNEEGVTAMEYSLIAAATVVAISLILPGVGDKLSQIFSTISVAI